MSSSPTAIPSGSRPVTSSGIPAPQSVRDRQATLRQQFAVKSLLGLWVIALLISGVYLFSKGFLLTRSTLAETSNCAQLPSYDTSASHSPSTTCWHPARYQRALVVVIDALRFDFILPKGMANSSTVTDWEFLRDPAQYDARYLEHQVLGRSWPHPYHHGKLPVLERLLYEQPTHSQLYRFMADPPTTTLQRLKGLTTGTLPTFIDMGSNFAGSAISEDNWLHQWFKQLQEQYPVTENDTLAGDQTPPVVFMGDDTWMSLFPDILESPWVTAYPYSSFDVWDLHTLDNGVLDRLGDILPGFPSKALKQFEVNSGPPRDSQSSLPTPPTLLNENPSWRLAIAHLLGVDHCGHRYGPNHPTMASKLGQMDRMLEEIIHIMDNDTLLIVMGDHGMDPKGDHGGDHPLELEAGLFMYSKGTPLVPWGTPSGEPNRHSLARVFAQVDSQVDEPSLASYVNGLDRNIYRSVTQTDLVPTLSLLLGLPIPYNSLGTIIPEFMFTGQGDVPGINSWTHLLRAAQLNCHQTLRYVDTYTSYYPASALPADQRDQILERLQRADRSMQRLMEGAQKEPSSVESQTWISEAEQALADYLVFSRSILVTFRQRWAQFDDKLMVAGLLVLLAACLALSSNIVRVNRMDAFALAIEHYESLVLGSLLGGIIALVGFVRWSWMPLAWHTVLDIILGSHDFTLVDLGLTGTCIGSVVGWCIGAHISRWLEPAPTAKPSVNPSDTTEQGIAQSHWLDWVVVGAVFIGHISIFASNSFVVFEDHVVRFLIQTLLGYWVFRAFTIANPSVRNRVQGYGVLLLLLTRLTSYVTVCREEQAPYCVSTFYASPGSTVSSPFVTTALLAAAVIFPHWLSRQANRDNNLHGLAPVWYHFGMRGVLFLAACYWTIDTLEGQAALTVGTTTAPTSTSFLPGVISEILGPLSALGNWHTVKLILARLVMGLGLVVAPLGWAKLPFTVDVVLPPTERAPRTGSPSNAVESGRRFTVLGIPNIYGSSYLLLVTMVFTFLVLVQQPMGGLMLYLMFFQLLCALEFFIGLNQVQSSVDTKPIIPTFSPSLLRVVQVLLFGLLSWHYFFATGHQAVISSIQWSTAFVGLSRMHLLLSGVLVIVNTLGSFILTALVLPLAVLWRFPIDSPRSNTSLASRIGQCAYLYLLYQTILLISSALFAGHFRRHLMVWKIFAPRFMLAGPVVALSAIVLVFLATGWATYKVVRDNNRLLKLLGSL
ncbi:mannose-ethanolamine phosphotransferase gpi13 [Dispira parvispora]|uniref:Mannose-ethanolamine phosphotransferase gpi13 n=1 Tax=Dispira parvispora TaxID=1520584 RepID=A0A9W8AS31_9FUNG|nr:mannose-ethanolamine phosphotransferase gpi13 [Dispira parvispora]